MVHTFHGHVFHSYFGKLTTSFYKNIERYLARHTSAIIAISEIQKMELVQEHRICSSEKVSVIPLGFDLTKFQTNQEEKRILFRTKYDLDEDEIAISIIGRVVPVKNHILFLEGLKIVSQKSTLRIRAFIVGDGEERKKIESKASELKIPFVREGERYEKKLLTFTSWIKEVDIVLAGSDIIALTSFNEGTPVSLIEAQAANKPIVSTNVGGIENVVIPDKTALLCESYNVEQFSNQLLKLIESPELRSDMGQLGWEHVKKKYHYERLVNDVENLYRRLLK